MGRFLHPFTNFTRSERSAEKSPPFKRKEKRVVKKKKEKEILLIEGFSINVSRRKGIIFSARKRPFHLFFSSHLPRAAVAAAAAFSPHFAIFPSLPVRAGNLLERTDVFFRWFSCGTFSRRWQRLSSGSYSGIDNAQDAAGIRPSIIVEDKSVWWRVSVQWCEWVERARPFAMEKNACGGSGRTETIIYTVWRTIGSSEGRAKNGIKWILAKDNR